MCKSFLLEIQLILGVQASQIQLILHDPLLKPSSVRCPSRIQLLLGVPASWHYKGRTQNQGHVK